MSITTFSTPTFPLREYITVRDINFNESARAEFQYWCRLDLPNPSSNNVSWLKGIRTFSPII